MKLIIHRLALFVLIATFIVAVWIVRPPVCDGARPKGLAVGTILRLYGC